MESFDEWVKSTAAPSVVEKWADRLLELGASWDSFKLGDPEQIVQDLKSGGVPVLAARDIVSLASAAVKRNMAPLAIFWDIENTPIPAGSSGRSVTSRLKSVLAPYGDLVQFRGYASIGLGLIPQEKRSDLQMSGCHLVDCPHNGRKEVADKMIIVDAMEFAFTHPEGASLCFITGDVDYAYLLAVLQRRPQFRTIIISKGTMQSMLQVNCEMKMRWETDILQMRPSFVPQKSPPGFHHIAHDDDGGRALSNAAATFDKRDGTGSRREDSPSMHSKMTMPAASEDDDDEEETPKFESLTADEEWTDDVELLRSIVRSIGGGSSHASKSLVCSKLRDTNPASFQSREDVRKFVTQALEARAVLEVSQGSNRLLRLPSDGENHVGPVITPSASLPVSFEEMPERALEVISALPFVLFVPWKFCPEGNTFPTKTFVRATKSKSWGIVMFRTLTDAQRTVTELPWLRKGTLVDSRRVALDDTALSMAECALCQVENPAAEMKMLPDTHDLCCPECLHWDQLDSASKGSAVAMVLSMLEGFAKNDDIFVGESIVRKMLVAEHPRECTSRKLAKLWIQECVDAGSVISFKRTKTKLLCLPCHEKMATEPFPREDLDTSAEEEHIVGMIWEQTKSCNWIRRIDAIESLKTNFDGMSTPLLRSKVFLNAHKKGRLFLAKCGFWQVVALSEEDAEIGLDTLRGENNTLDGETAGTQNQPFGTVNAVVALPELTRLTEETSASKNAVVPGPTDGDSDDDEPNLEDILIRSRS